MAREWELVLKHLSPAPNSLKGKKNVLTKQSVKCSIMLMNLKANDYNDPVLLFNLIPTYGAVLFTME